MLTKSTILKFYKRREVQEALVEHAKNKEIGMRFQESFGKRPDIISYPRDVIELALKGVTSFHASEEIWSNPLALSSNNTKEEQEELRQGWDLVLDIDCPDWEFSKLTAYLFVKALQDNKVKDISVKFSGNKGFHIGVPFEAFPKKIADKDTKSLFPESPQKISRYLLDYIADNYVSLSENKITFLNRYAYTLEQLKEKFGEKKFFLSCCQKCRKEIKPNEQKEEYEFICHKCERKTKDNLEFRKCEYCHVLMEKMELQKSLCSCGSNQSKKDFEIGSIIEVDTILISSRHLYRMPYSLHEKSGLVSLPILPEDILSFEKERAKPENVKEIKIKFLDRDVSGESARLLLQNAYDHNFKIKIEEKEKDLSRNYEEFQVTSPIKEDFFPPCIRKALLGMDDGKKRAVFILTNYLGKIGWNKQEIEQCLQQWNGKNQQKLREVYLKGQLQSFIPGDKLPPNCNNESYYKGLGICHPDGLCTKIKNPVNYTLIRWKQHLENKEKEDKELKRLERKRKKEEKEKQYTEFQNQSQKHL